MADFNVSNTATLGVNFAYTNNDYLDTEFGLLDATYSTIGVDFSYSITDQSSFNAFYDYARWMTDQRGRQSGATPATTIAFDWTADLDDKFNTLGAGYTQNFRKNKFIWDTYLIYALANGNLDTEAGASVRPT